MKKHQQFRVYTEGELRNAFEFFKDIWDKSYTLKDEVNHFNRYASNSSLFVCYTGKGLQLNNQMGGFEVIENPLDSVKKEDPFEDEELIHRGMVNNPVDIEKSNLDQALINLQAEITGKGLKTSTAKELEKAVDAFKPGQDINPQDHYDNSEGSLYLWCDKKGLNPWEFDIIKRVMRCRKKGQFTEDLKKTKDLIDIYLREYDN